MGRITGIGERKMKKREIRRRRSENGGEKG
jgi:hypothetical protein